MNLYFELLKTPVFTVEDVNQYYNNADSARSAIKRLMKEKMVAKIRNNMYTCISGETGEPVANRFQIASRITPTSYVSHHTAIEYYGIANQVFYDVHVSSETSFREFEFEGYTYRCLSSKTMEGVESPEYSGGIRITNIERTLVDSIKDMDKVTGLEEVYQAFSGTERLQEEKILKYLEVMSNQFLYQKTGFLLSADVWRVKISKKFFEICKSRIGKSKRYLTKDISRGHYVNEWKLIVPDSFYFMNNGVIEDAAV